MINLVSLNARELAQLDAAITQLDGALEGLLERGIVDEQDGVDLLELSDAVAAEIEFREVEGA
ncbi:MAG: hypothetical protein ABI700_00755 [Chloroflexota bacterium]